MSRRAVARAIRDHADKAAKRARPVRTGIVVDLDPLRVELAHGGLVLEVEDDFDLTGLAELYDRDYGIEEGDTVLLIKSGDDWLVFDVRPDEVAEKGKGQEDTDEALTALTDAVDALTARVEALEAA